MQPTPADRGGALRVFISYRRDDAPDAAGRLYDALVDRFGTNVFMDVDTIEPGLDFVEVLNRAVASCDVLVALIGRGWLTSTDANGRRRLDNPEDFVRLEIEAALKRDVRVIPVLLHGVEMPASNELPDSLANLARRNALQIDYTRWRDDVRRLLQTLERLDQENVKRAEAQGGTREQSPSRATQDVDQKTQQLAPEPVGREAREGAVGKLSKRRIWTALAVLDALALLVFAVTAEIESSHLLAFLLTLAIAGLGWGFGKSSARWVKLTLAATLAMVALASAVWVANLADANAAAAAVLLVAGVALLGWGLGRAVVKSRVG